MAPLSHEDAKKYFFWAVLLALIVTSFFIIKPFIISLVSAFVLAFFIKPLHTRLSKKLNTKFSAFLCVLLISLIIIIPLWIIATNLSEQALDFAESGGKSKVITAISELSIIKSLGINPEEISTRASEWTVSTLTNTFQQIPEYLILSIVILIAIYYLLIEWHTLAIALKKCIPHENKEGIILDIKQTTYGIIYGYFLFSLIEFAIALLGFYLSGVQYYLFAAILVAILAFTPFLDPIVVWLPMVIYHIVYHNYFIALGILITGAIITFFVETVLFGKIVGGKARIHPFLTLIGAMGGVIPFGISGVIIGPIILLYTVRIIEELIKKNS